MANRCFAAPLPNRARKLRVFMDSTENLNIAFMVTKQGNICFGSLCPGSKNVFDLRQKHFLISAPAKFVSATGLAAKLGNSCLRNNAFYFKIIINCRLVRL